MRGSRAVLAAAVLVLLAACGGGGTKSAVKSSTTTTAPGAQPPTNTPTSAIQSTTAVPVAKGSWTDTGQVNAANPNTTLVVVECASAQVGRWSHERI